MLLYKLNPWVERKLLFPSPSRYERLSRRELLGLVFPRKRGTPADSSNAASAEQYGSVEAQDFTS
jgi:hypothetical protein